MVRYYITGWSARFGNWQAEVLECLSMEAAKLRFLAEHPMLKHIKAYPLRVENLEALANPADVTANPVTTNQNLTNVRSTANVTIQKGN